MPLFADLPAGRTYERHGHGAAHSADLLGVRGLAVGTDDTLASGEILLLLLMFFELTNSLSVLESLLFFLVFNAFTL